MTRSELATQYRSLFGTITRDDGTTIWAVIDHNTEPDELRHLCRDAHGDLFPDDFIYGQIVDALDSFSDEHYDPETIIDELEADVYNSDRLRWLASNLNRPDMVNEAVAEFGRNQDRDFDIMEIIGWGQLQEKQNIYRSVLASLDALCSVEAE